MKNFNFLLIFVFAATTVFAQTIYTDDFETYTVGDGIADQDTTGTWTTWSETPGSAEDPLVTDAAANQGTQSMVIEGTNDGVLLLNDLTENRYRVEFYLMVPEGFLGYYNILQDFAGGSSVWGMQLFFEDGVGTIDGNGYDALDFTYTPGEWMKIQHFVDLDNDWIDFYIDGELIHAYQWSNGVANDETGINKLDAFNFYAWDDGGAGTPKYYMDDYIIEQVDIPNPPLNFAIEVINGNDVNITWDAPTEGTPDSYSVIRDGAEIAVVDVGTSYLDENLYPGDYDYQVKAFYGEAVGYSASAGLETASIPGGNMREVVLFEIWTGTWCSYCPTAAGAIDEMAVDYTDIAVIEYHGLNGDIYETSATAIRHDYYVPTFDDGDGAFGYPTTIVNGMFGMEGAMPTVADQKAIYEYYYDEYIDIPTVYTISPTVDLISSNPSVFDIDIDVEETFPYYEDEIRLFVALTETNIPETWQTETEVNFVLRDMLPDANGTVLDFTAGSIHNETMQLTLDGSYVRSNCELVIFVQNMATAEIMEAGKIDLGSFVGIENNETLKLSVYPNPSNDFVNVVASETIELIAIYSLTGQLVYQVNPESNSHNFSTEAFANGVYNMKINTQNGSQVKQLIIQ